LPCSTLFQLQISFVYTFVFNPLESLVTQKRMAVHTLFVKWVGIECFTINEYGMPCWG